MALYGWSTCPAETKEQVEGLTGAFLGILGANLVGVYLHGSLAMGCFNPRQSDLDLLVVTARPLSPEAKPQLGRLMLAASGAPHAVELSVLSQSDLEPWKHPAGFSFHYSETWRDETQQQLSGTWRLWEGHPTDPDLAAHVAVTKRRGIHLHGAPIAQVFPVVPREDLLASVLLDVHGALGALGASPVYGALNACRALAYVREGLLLSKHEGGLWALAAVPDPVRPTVKTALNAYATRDEDARFPAGALPAFSRWARQALPPRGA